ncbi:proline iminopeptidase [Dyadobacter soli]|uniref:Proline iminopeptidase n=2 Tax=Dyadobacter soli TaxID=659014 RepID=A0A1G7S7L2_9BACT|nr:proline iminopeptidase [Dyadobacter soli]
MLAKTAAPIFAQKMIESVMKYIRKSLKIIWVLPFLFSQLYAQKAHVIQSADGIPLHVREYGQGKPVVLLAGGPGFNAAYLEPIWKALPQYRFVVPDQRGTGSSVVDRLDSSVINVNQYVEDLELMRKQLHIDKLMLAGHSWGGMLALAYAARYPRNVDRLVLLGPGGITQNFFKYFKSNIRMRLREEDVAESKAANNFALSLKAIWPGYFYNRDKALATKMLVDTNLANYQSGKVNSLALSDYKKTESTRVASLRKFTRPVYIIQGRQDPVGESTVYETKSIIPQTEILFIENCGHLPWLESEAAATQFFDLLKASLK